MKRKSMNLYVVNSISSSDSVFQFSASKSKRRESIRIRIFGESNRHFLPNGKREGEWYTSTTIYKNGIELFRVEKEYIKIGGKWGCFSLQLNKYDLFKFILSINEDSFNYTLNYDLHCIRKGTSFEPIMKKKNLLGLPISRKKNLFCRTFTVPLIDKYFFSYVNDSESEI